MFYLSQGLADVWLLSWFAAAPLLWLAYGDTPRWQVVLASASAFACGQIYLFQCYWKLLPLVALAPILIVLGLGFVGTVLLTREVYRRGAPALALMIFPASWTGFEYLLGMISPHGTFGALGYAATSFPAAIQVAALFGVHAVAFMLCLAASALALLLRGQRRVGAIGVAICLLCLGYGVVRLSISHQSTVRVAALSDQDVWRRQNEESTVASERAAAQVYADFIRTLPGVRVVVIPEGAITLPPQNEDLVLAPLRNVAKATGAMVVAGTFVAEPMQNRAFAFMPDGTSQTYAKRHLLMPFEPEAPGSQAGVLGQGYATQICKDMDFPGSVRGTAAHGIRLMTVPANDFGADAWIHARMAIMRGVENGFGVVRAAFNGMVSISDAQGRVLKAASTQTAGMVAITADVPLGAGATLYTRVGEIFSWLCLAFSGYVCTSLLRRRRWVRVSAA
jgi:apolipoprotein N-acyltransferase